MGFNTLILIMAFFFFPIIEFTTLNWKQTLSLNQLLCHAGLYHFPCIISSKIYPDKQKELMYIIVLNLKIITLGADTQKFVQWKIEEFTITDQTKSINQDSSNVS